MYNEARKEAYLDSLKVQKDKSNFKTITTAAKDFEDEYGKDLAQFNRNEVIALMNAQELTNPLTIKSYLNVIRNYQIAMDEMDMELALKPVSKYDVDLASALKKHFYCSYDQLLADIEKGIAIDEGFPAPAALTLAWIGMPTPEVFDLESENVDLKSGMISRFPKRDLVFGEREPKALKVLRSYVNTTQAYRTRNSTYQVYKSKNNPYFLQNMVTKSDIDKPGKKYSKTSFSADVYNMKMRAENQGAAPNFTYRDILRSGEMHRLYLAEQKGFAVLNSFNSERVCAMVEGKIPYYEIAYQYKAYKKAFDLT